MNDKDCDSACIPLSEVLFRYTLWLLLMLVAFSTASCAPAATEQPAPQILAVEPSSMEVARYEKLELAVALKATYDNPYDVRQVDLTAVFTGPDGREWLVPGFLA